MSLLQKHIRCVLRSHVAASQVRFQQTQTKVTQKDGTKSEAFIPARAPVFKNVKNFPNNFALRDSFNHYTYANIFLSAKQLSSEISRKVGAKTNERVLFLCPNDASYVITLWAIWMSGQIAVPLSPLHPQNLLLYYANDTNAKLLVTTKEYADMMQRVGKNTHTTLYVLDDKLNEECTQKGTLFDSDYDGGLPDSFYENSNGMIVYTSGTTGNPKGVVLTHKNIKSQVNTLLDAWKWSQNDVMLHTLPLHHIHGIVNALLCPLSVGAKTIMLPQFNANTVWTRLLGVNAKSTDRKITVFMAVPTIYAKLIEEHGKVFGEDQKMVEHVKNTLKNKVRLMVSGSAPLPTTIFENWLEISGHRLLERYGMTEIGMAISNLYDDPGREPGFVGMPLPGVSIRIVESSKVPNSTLLECTNEDGNIVFKSPEPKTDVQGELLVKGDNVFKEYFNRPETTKSEFTEDGWFKTGDICQYSAIKRKIKMLGRTSTDIIKSGGYKISALEIETHLLSHEDISDCSVVGLQDPEWGERVAAIVVLKKDKDITLEQLKEWATDKMPKYAVPSVLKIVSEIPKNPMGKVNKKELVKTLFAK